MLRNLVKQYPEVDYFAFKIMYLKRNDKAVYIFYIYKSERIYIF